MSRDLVTKLRDLGFVYRSYIVYSLAYSYNSIKELNILL